jgi:hypothetical protein
MQMSKIKEMLDYSRVEKDLLALFSDKSTEDEKIVAAYRALKKQQLDESKTENIKKTKH